ncbi:MAG: polyprenyl synthetase family protein, partial [Myxococcales bacterium]|nr:polyprenyl synthetase family protein [Myxococcales bacterium]
LIHDDWMDQDEMRRGGPSVHAIFRNTYGDAHLGDCVGILAGDLASTYAWELMLRVPAPPGRGAELLERFLRIQKEVYCGQHLDVTADADTDRMHDLKTGSYTVRGPLLLGGILGDASSEALSALEAFGDPLGHAFQLRDDLLGTFGDQASLGKPIGSDLRAGKRTALIFEAERALDEEGRKRLHALLGLADPRRAEFGEAELAEAMALLIRSGAKAAVERRLAAYLEQAEAALEGAGFGREGAERLRGVARSLAMRGR